MAFPQHNPLKKKKKKKRWLEKVRKMSMKLVSSSSLSFKCALRESGCRIGYEPMKNELRSLFVVDIQGYQCRGFYIVPHETSEAHKRLQKHFSI